VPEVLPWERAVAQQICTVDSSWQTKPRCVLTQVAAVGAAAVRQTERRDSQITGRWGVAQPCRSHRRRLQATYRLAKRLFASRKFGLWEGERDPFEKVL